MAATAAVAVPRSAGLPEGRSPQVVAPPKSAPRPARPIGQGRLRPPTRRRRVLAPHVVASPARGPRPASPPLVVLVGLAVVVALAILGLGSFAGAMTGADVPTTTTVVRVEPGETLSDLAARMAPDSDVTAVVDKIRELNALDGSMVRAGQPLRVPSSR
ncbi:LysM domain-containing protein [Actinokineospora alba]|uniref:LysM domain-containing protein n=1 Tax=Actinokineospora alba TaxID=504798 RepID=A0A1H0JH69_9PSEU|nr:LysM peptidoglycan-binding domain-containing protein [Actinokineospora alba]TDP68300.1 LysM domain-containing protein [Actinokineospora alba]SDH96398.1 LysM domain-containing protein [Actinokineospora alba]SDO42779.1 LysM domain-containing protein [Actinokineospora alba]